MNARQIVESPPMGSEEHELAKRLRDKHEQADQAAWDAGEAGFDIRDEFKSLVRTSSFSELQKHLEPEFKLAPSGQYSVRILKVGKGAGPYGAQKWEVRLTSDSVRLIGKENTRGETITLTDCSRHTALMAVVHLLKSGWN